MLYYIRRGCYAMDINAIISLIQGVGFPIFACLAMGWYVKYITDQHREDTANRDKEHKEQISSITDSLNNNTIAIQKLADLLTNYFARETAHE